MNTSGVTATTTSIELAAIVSEALTAAGIVATLSGGGAVSAYTDNRYESRDLDFVTTALLAELKQALEQAKLVATYQANVIDWRELDAWVIAEDIGNAREVIEFYRDVRGSPPPA